MEKIVFYSWQSDLPNNTNRTFIQVVIERAIGQLNKENLHLELVLDSDTKRTEGASEIANTILSKIGKSKIFIADVTIVYSDNNKRKCPNPNVLIELGYAAKSIGWSNIICICNTQYGAIDDLPFDIRHRKIISYSTVDFATKRESQIILTNKVKEQISLVAKKIEGLQTITNYIKSAVDKIILSICNDLFKLVHQYEYQFDPKTVWDFLSINRDDLNRLLGGNKFIGFSLFKTWKEYSDEIAKIINQPLFIEHSTQELKGSCIRVIENLNLFSHFLTDSTYFKSTGLKASEFEIVSGLSLTDENPINSFILGKKTDSQHLVVVDSCNLNKHAYLNALNIIELNEKKSDGFLFSLAILILSIKKLIEENGNSILIRP
ncbi:hypothetical protein [Agriterribacter humi]|uniref:hypothetical protein n=1 Tax=Agriterribacter humi TaxID=1104781 RepID=UPI00126432C9|nr:hypothetical protein [Agriterribacter humi]